MTPRRVVALAASLLVLLLGAAPPRAAGPAPSPPLVFAAASLTDVLRQIAADYAGGSPGAVRLSFGSSATLARQIEAGAPAELFFSADRDWMQYVVERALVRPDRRVDLLGNSLVLIAPSSSQLRSLSLSRASIGAALGNSGRLALADPASVPAGKYAKAAMTHLGLWDAIASRTVSADHVRTALQFVARGEAALGVVYETDARAEPRVRIVASFPPDSHPPIVYPLALTVRASPAAEAFFRHLLGAAARARFEAAGFRVLPGAPSTRFADGP